MFNMAALQKSIFMEKPPNVNLAEKDGKSSLCMLVSQKYHGTECSTKADSWPMSQILANPVNHQASLLWTLWAEANEHSRVENQSLYPSPDNKEKITLYNQ